MSIFLVFTLESCTSTTESKHLLEEIENSIYNSPDSSLILLGNILHPELLSKEDHAHYAFLLSLTRWHSALTLTDDSLIYEAEKYYSQSADYNKRGILAFLMSTIVPYNEKHNDTTIRLLKNAEFCFPYIRDKRVLISLFAKLGIIHQGMNNQGIAAHYFKKARLLSVICDSNYKFYISSDNPLPTNKNILFNSPPFFREMYSQLMGVYYLNLNNLRNADSCFRQSVYTTHYLLPQTLSYLENHTQLSTKQSNGPLLQDFMSQKTDSIYEFSNWVHTHQQILTNKKFNIFIWTMSMTLGVFFSISLIRWLSLRKSYLNHIASCTSGIRQIALLTEQNQKLEQSIKELNIRLNRDRYIHREMLEVKNEWTNTNDIQSLGVYLKMTRDKLSFNLPKDLPSLLHWLDITASGFSLKLLKHSASLTPTERAICCFVKMGYSWEEVAILLNIKVSSVKRNVYRICQKLHLMSDQHSFVEFIRNL